jgi:pumilio RNA-binding family
LQHAFENLEESAKDGIVDEILNQGSAVFSEVAKSQWGAYCIQHSKFGLVRPASPSLLTISRIAMRSVLEHGSANHRQLTIDHLLEGLLEYATHEQGSKSVTKALKEGGKEMVDRVVKRMCEPAKGYIYLLIADRSLVPRR